MSTKPSPHQCSFPEEQEPSGRLILAPCLICGISAVDALSILAKRVAALEGALTDTIYWGDATFDPNGRYPQVMRNAAGQDIILDRWLDDADELRASIDRARKALEQSP